MLTTVVTNWSLLLFYTPVVTLSSCNRSILQTGLPPGFHARHPARHQHPKHALQDEQADLDVQRHLSLRDPASRWRIPQQLSSLTGNMELHVVNNYIYFILQFQGWASRRRMRRRDADIPSSFQVREKGQVHQHPQRGWSQRQGEDSGICRDQEAGRLPLPQLVRGGALDLTS